MSGSDIERAVSAAKDRTKRELFAALVLAADIAAGGDERVCPPERYGDVDAWREEVRAADAARAVKWADALLAALARTEVK